MKLQRYDADGDLGRYLCYNRRAARDATRTQALHLLPQHPPGARLENLMIEIPLTQNQIALIDDDDFELISRHKWCASWNPHTKSFDARTKIHKPDGKRTALLMHRLVMNAQPGQQVDHVHHLTLDNRKSELRLCTGAQNQHNRGPKNNNTSGYKGVHWFKRDQNWCAQITVNSKCKHLGYFATPQLAHEAYCKAALDLHGEFARTA